MRFLARLAARLLSVLLILLVLVILDPMGAAFASGTTMNVAIVYPTVYSSGDALPASDIASVTIQWSFVGAQTKTITAPSTATTITILCGKVSVSAFVTTTASALYPSVAGTVSPSAVYDTGVVCKPGAPVVTVS